MISLEEDILSRITTTPPTPYLKFELKVGDRYVNSKGIIKEDWKPLEQNSYINSVINEEIEYRVNPVDKTSSYNKERLYSRLSTLIVNDIKTLFIQMSFNKAPRMTKVWKRFVRLLPGNYSNINIRHEPMIKDCIKLLEYRYKIENTKDSDSSILCKENEVHRKNIYGLLLLMEKKHGKKKSC